MSLLDRVARSASSSVRNAWSWTYDPPSSESLTNTTGSPSNTVRVGMQVDKIRGLQLTVSYACIRLRAETIAGLPVHAIEYEGGRRVQRDPAPWMEAPNRDTTPFELIEAWIGSLDVDGNAMSWVDLDNLGRVAEVWPLDPGCVEVERDPWNKPGPNRNPRRYRLDGRVVPELSVNDRRSGIFHIKGFGGAGRLRGINPVQWHMHSLGLAVAAEEYGESYFANGTVMSGLVEVPGSPGKEKLTLMRDSIAEAHAGPRNAHKPGFLLGGAKWTQLQLSNEDSQFLETRKFQAEEVARIWRVPPHKVGILDRATFSNIEHQGIEWATDGVAPYTGRVEAAVLHAGMLPMGQRLRFNLAGLSKGDLKSTVDALNIGRNGGWWSANDIRAKLDENDIGEQGDVYLQPLNMVDAAEGALETAAVTDAYIKLISAGMTFAEIQQTLAAAAAARQEATA